MTGKRDDEIRKLIAVLGSDQFLRDAKRLCRRTARRSSLDKMRPKKLGVLVKDADRAVAIFVHIRDEERCVIHERARQMGLADQLPSCNEARCAFHIIPKVDRKLGWLLRWNEENIVCSCSSLNFWESNNRHKWFAIWPTLFPEKSHLLTIPTFKAKHDRKTVEGIIWNYTKRGL